MGADAHPAFRLAEKHFKNRATPALPALQGLPADLCASVLDLSRPIDADDDPVWKAGWWGSTYGDKPRRKGKERARGERPNADLSGLRSLRLADGKTGYIVSEGCILIPNYLSAAAQEELLLSALGRYILPPNPLSLSTHYALPPDLWGLYVSDPEATVRPRHMDLDPEQRTAQAEADRAKRGPRTLIETTPAATIGYDEVKRRNAQWTGDVVSLKLPPKTASALMREIRWANLGWVYQWSTKSYDFSTDDPIPFPPELATTCCEVVGKIPWVDVYADAQLVPDWQTWSDDYKPDTGIVNYYQRNDTLMAHVDRSELDPSRPLVSISLGNACIFLSGSDSRDDPPRPIILRSGDVFIMSGKGRQSYHGVPRIMEDTLPSHFAVREDDSAEMCAAKEWIATARVNINARQVFPPGFQRPAEVSQS